MKHGILPVWKERGMTSHDVVFKLRKILKMKKIGHTGTLDPEVEGVLPICLGDATRIASLITDTGKEYVAKVKLGWSTETEDQTGEIVERDSSYKQLSRAQIEEALAKLTGEIEQTPPMYSAVKVNGKRLYEYAREGRVIDRPSRIVQIDAIELLEDAVQFEGEAIEFSIRVSCGKGTYIRTLAVQIGELLGYPAHMSQLERTMSGGFRAEQCITLQQLQEAVDEGKEMDAIRPLEEALFEFPQVQIEESMLPLIENGQVLQQLDILKTHSYVVLMNEGKALAIYMRHPTKEGLMKPFKMFPFNR
ncbi:tRNA pseudouridine(55) synthase TruB [Savagea faecisuis]|uniref:tRNA pseudouridine synthase B n=1 Tax=Savagea faecisuis TaxID=1274803 RepID=A0ABW3H145_9BACL